MHSKAVFLFFISNQSRVQYSIQTCWGWTVVTFVPSISDMTTQSKKNKQTKQLNKTKQKSIMAATESQSVFKDALVAMAWCEDFEKTRKKREEKEKKDIDLGTCTSGSVWSDLKSWRARAEGDGGWGGQKKNKKKEQLEEKKKKTREREREKKKTQQKGQCTQWRVYIYGTAQYTQTRLVDLFSKHGTSWRHLVFRPASCSSALPSFSPFFRSFSLFFSMR